MGVTIPAFCPMSQELFLVAFFLKELSFIMGIFLNSSLKEVFSECCCLFKAIEDISLLQKEIHVADVSPAEGSLMTISFNETKETFLWGTHL